MRAICVFLLCVSSAIDLLVCFLSFAFIEGEWGEDEVEVEGWNCLQGLFLQGRGGWSGASV